MNLTLGHSIRKKCHKNCITALSPSGNLIASGGKDSTVLVHQHAEANLVTVAKFDLAEADRKCNVTCVDCQGDLVLAATTLGAVNVLDRREGAVSRLSAHKSVASFVKFFTDDATLVASAGFDRRVRLWDLRNPRVPFQDLIGHTAGVNYLDSLECGAHDDGTVRFSDNFERVLSCGSDSTVRLWNVSRANAQVNRGTHLVFKVPTEMSLNAECCCLLRRSPSYAFAVGLDDNHLLVYTTKLKTPVASLSLGAGTAINCVRAWGGHVLVGTSAGAVHVVRVALSDDGTRCELEQVARLELPGSVNDFRLRGGPDELTVFAAAATELRLGRWATNLGAANQIVVNTYRLAHNLH